MMMSWCDYGWDKWVRNATNACKNFAIGRGFCFPHKFVSFLL